MKTKFGRIVSLIIVFTICLISFNYVESNEIKVEATSVSQLQKEIKELKQKQKEYKAIADNAKNNAQKEKEKQAAISGQISTNEALIAKFKQQITALETNINAETKRIEEQEKQIEKGIEDFKSRLRAMYLSGNESLASVMLGATDFFDVLMKMELVERVAEHDNQIIDNLIKLKKEHEATKAKLENDRKDLEKSQKEQQGILNKLEKLYSQSQSIIKQQENLAQKYKNMTDAQQAAEERAEKELDELIRKQQEGSNIKFNGKFRWPVANFPYISSPFGWRTIYGRRNFHKGIDIASSGGKYIYGKPISASASGKVIVAFKNDIPGYSYGKYVAIDHGDGYSTVYGHCSRLAVKAGQYVSAGQTIAYVGSTGFSTGAHLHFEIRQGTQKLDPQKFVRPY